MISARSVVRFCTLALIAGVFFSGSARAESVQSLLMATSDVFPDQYQLSIVLNDEGVATGLRYSSSRRVDLFPIGDLKKGIVLLRHSDRAIILLQADAFDTESGGEMKMSFLFSGITMQYKKVSIEIMRVGGVWEFRVDGRAGRRNVSEAYFKANRVLGKVVGINTVTFN